MTVLSRSLRQWLELVFYAAVLGAVLGILVHILFFSNVAMADTGQPPLGDLPAFGSLLRYAEQHEVTVTSRHSIPLEKGLALWGRSERNGNVWVASDITPESRVCVLAHELTHAVLQSPQMDPDDSETEAYYVGGKVCDSLGYQGAAERQLLQIRRFHGRISVGALLFAETLSTVAAG